MRPVALSDWAPVALFSGFCARNVALTNEMNELRRRAQFGDCRRHQKPDNGHQGRKLRAADLAAELHGAARCVVSIRTNCCPRQFVPWTANYRRKKMCPLMRRNARWDARGGYKEKINIGAVREVHLTLIFFLYRSDLSDLASLWPWTPSYPCRSTYVVGRREIASWLLPLTRRFFLIG